MRCLPRARAVVPATPRVLRARASYHARQLDIAGHSVRWLPSASYLLRQVVVAGYAVLASCVAGCMAVARKIAGHVELQLILPTFSDRAPRPL